MEWIIQKYNQQVIENVVYKNLLQNLVDDKYGFVYQWEKHFDQ